MKGPSNCSRIDNSYNLREAPFKIVMPLDYKLSKQSCKPQVNVHLRVALCDTQGKNTWPEPSDRDVGSCSLCCTHVTSATFPPPSRPRCSLERGEREELNTGNCCAVSTPHWFGAFAVLHCFRSSVLSTALAVRSNVFAHGDIQGKKGHMFLQGRKILKSNPGPCFFQR